MDDDFLPWNEALDINIFLEILNKMHPMIKFTIEPSTHHENNTQTINFLDVKVILHENGKVDTDIYYKETNTQDYLNYQSHHPIHVKKNIPYNLAKRIIVFVSNEKTMNYRLKELKEWLINCNYPESIINKAFHNAKLQGPAPNPENDKETIPYVTTYFTNYCSRNIVNTANECFKNSNDEDINNVFGNTKIVLAQKQTPNLLRILSRPKINTTPENGIFKCKNEQCKLCELYIQECKSFELSNKFNWTVKCRITCHSKNVIYFLACNNCDCTYIGKTNELRKRMNNHISESRHGNTKNILDKHVFNCLGPDKIEPYFRIYVLLEVNDPSKLLTYESNFHNKGFDTMNKKF